MLKKSIIILIMFLLLPAKLFAAGANRWDTDKTVCYAGYDQNNPVIVSDGDEGAIIFWEDYETDPSKWGWIYAQRITSTGTPVWTDNGVQVSTYSYIPSTISYLKAISDGSGGAIAVWQDNRNGNDDIYCQKINSNGVRQWGEAGVEVITGAGNQSLPAICPEGAGGVVVAWQDDSDVYAQRISSSGVKVWTSTGVVVCSAANDQSNPKVAYDESSGVLVVWEDKRTTGDDKDVFIQKLSLGDGSSQWQSNGIPLSTTIHKQIYPDLVHDGQQGVVVAWWDAATNIYTPYVQRVSSSGVAQWTQNGEKLSTAAKCNTVAKVPEFKLSRATDTSGGVFMVWTDMRNVDDIDLYAQYFGGNTFTKYWSSDGVIISTRTYHQRYQELITTTDNEAMVSWFDEADDSIRAQKLDPGTGNLKWTNVYGVRVSTTKVSSGINPEIISDEHSGVFVTWWDNKGFSNNIYAQRTDDGDEIPPCEVTTLVASVGNKADDIKLEWTAPGDDGTVGAATSYVVKYATYSAGSSTSTWWSKVDVHTYSQTWPPESYGVEEQEDLYLTGGVTYFVIMKVVDDAGNWSGFSNETSAIAFVDNIPPPKINTITANRSGVLEGQIKLTWTSPADNDTVYSGIAKYYEIRYSSGNSFNWDTATVWASSMTVTPPAGITEIETITNLTPKVTYYFRIQSTDEVPNYSDISCGATTWAQVDITEPGTITTLSALASSAMAGRINLQWQAPGDDGYTKNMGTCTFHIKYSSATPITSEATWVSLSSYSVVISSENVNVNSFRMHNITGLLDDTTYYFNIKTEDELNNESGMSVNGAYAKTKDIMAPSDITDLMAYPGAREVEILLTWSAPGDNGTTGNITGGEYRLQYSTYDAIAWDKDNYDRKWSTNTSPGDYQQYGISFSTDVEFGTTYYLRLWMTDETGTLWTEISNGVTSYTSNDIFPSNITHLEATTLTGLGNQGSIMLTWTAPGDDDIVGTVSNYVIKYSTAQFDCSSDSSTWNESWIRPVSELPSGPPPPPAEYGTIQNMKITGLANETTYYFAIWAVDDRLNESEITGTVYAVTIDTIPPSKLLITTLLPPKEETLRLTWTAPGDNGTEGNIVGGGYWIKMSTDSNDNWESISSSEPYQYDIYIDTDVSPGMKCVQVLTGLLNETTYYLWVRIRDERSSGEHDDPFPVWSELSDKTTDFTEIDGVEPATITDLSVGSTDYCTVELSWTSPSDNIGWMDDFNAEVSTISPRYEVRFSSTGLISATTTNFESFALVPSSMVYSLRGSTVPWKAGIQETWIITGLTNYVSYWFAIRTFDERSPNPNGSGVSTTTVIIPPDSVPPVISSYTAISGINLTGNWIVITATATDNFTGITDVDLYYRMNSTGPYEQYSMFSDTINPSVSPVIKYGKIELSTSTTIKSVQYYVRAVDRCWNEVLSTSEGGRRSGTPGYGQPPVSPHTITVSTVTSRVIGSAGGTVRVEDGNSLDGTTRLVILPGALSESTTIIIYPLNTGDLTPDQKTSAQDDDRIKTKTPVALVRLEPDGLFLLKNTTFYILYMNNEGNDNIVDNTSVVETNLSIFCWDGYMWRRKKSKVYSHEETDTAVRNTVATKINHFSEYALFEAFAVEPSSDDARPKENIITPNDDNINDYAEFSGLTGNYEIDILDINGRKIRTIRSSVAGDSPMWRGADDGGNTVNSGLYIYRIKYSDDTSKPILSGVIVVAK